MNYFNYFTEIENEFIKRRGSHLLVAPLDWSLIESWKQRGIPLHIVLRGITASFDGYDKRAQRGRKVNTLFFCQQEVEALYHDYCAAQTGANHETSTNGQATDDAAPFSKGRVLEYFEEHLQSLTELQLRHQDNAQLAETFERAVARIRGLRESVQASAVMQAEALETDLTLLEEAILAGLQASLAAEQREELAKAAAKQLRAHKDKMEAAVYAQTLANFIARRLREQFHVPRLSLFYLN